MTAIRERIFAKVEELLLLCGAAAEVERMPSGDPHRFPAYHIFDGGDEAADGEAGTDRWALSLEIEGTVEGGTGAEAHAAMHALDAVLIETLYAEPVLGGLATEIESTRFSSMVAERAAKRRLGFNRTFIIHYATRRGSPQVID